jgi:hypothetical protein
MKVCTKQVNNNGVVFTFANGDVVEAVLNKMPEEIVHQLALHGLSQKIGDSYASSESVAAAVVSATNTTSNLIAGLWATKSSNGGKIVEALSRVTGKTHSECLDAFNAMGKEQKADLRKHPEIKVALAKIEVERASKLKGGGSDLNELF